MKIYITILTAGCISAAAAQSPYISKVWEYQPAPGQFVNTMPQYAEGDDAQEMAWKAFEIIGGEANGVISLGAFGGYVVFSFDHTVINKPGDYDFTIEGNAFFSEDYSDGGSAEPGIVMVSRDINGNGLPDDPWYELAGSEYNAEGTARKYTITYYRPAADKEATAGDDMFITDTTYIRWTDNMGGEGYIMKNMFHEQSYWPGWSKADELTFTGTRLADNGVNKGDDSQPYYVLYPYAWGYADNYPNSDERTGFNIDWAVDDNGTPVALDGVDFIKVYTAVNQSCGWLGDTSTEVGRATDLHPEMTGVTTPVAVTSYGIRYSGGLLYTDGLTSGTVCDIYSACGLHVARLTLSDTPAAIDLASGIYVAKAQGITRKFVVK